MKYLTRLVLLRGMGLLYLAAFLTSAFQSRALFGTHGLSPAPGMIAAAQGNLQSYARPVPAFWLLEPFCSGDVALELVSWAGVFLSLLLIMLPTYRHGVWAGLPFALWGLYLSIVNLDGMIMRYGWEWETLEVGFLMIFLCPLLPVYKEKTVPTSELVLWLLRWGTFRLMIGAGMSKIGKNSSDCWFELTCTETHYETQPMPNMLAWFFHKLPPSSHKAEVAMTFFEQLVLPWFVLFPPVYGYGVPRYLRNFCFLCECFFQLCIVGTGNYAWINYVGAIPCFAMLDDAFLSHCPLTKWLFTKTEIEEANKLCNDKPLEKPASLGSHSARSVIGKLVRLGLTAFILFKSVAPIKELFTPAPWLHYYDNYFFVNAQGVFGFINKHRVVLVLETSHAPIEDIILVDKNSIACLNRPGAVARDSIGRGITCDDLEDYCGMQGVPEICPVTCGTCPQNILLAALLAPAVSRHSNSTDNIWTNTLEFKNLPGDVQRAPSFNSPYHYRFDWEVWIRTTASMEQAVDLQALHRMESTSWEKSKLQQGLPEMPVPPIVRSMVEGVLHGDSEVIGLLANDWDSLLHRQGDACQPPTAVRATYYLYKFSDWKDLLLNKTWWTRVPISKPRVLLPSLAARAENKGVMPVTPRQRHWILLAAVLGGALCIGVVESPSSRLEQGLAFPFCRAGLFVVYAIVFTIALVMDYPVDMRPILAHIDFSESAQWSIQLCTVACTVYLSMLHWWQPSLKLTLTFVKRILLIVPAVMTIYFSKQAGRFVDATSHCAK